MFASRRRTASFSRNIRPRVWHNYTFRLHAPPIPKPPLAALRQRFAPGIVGPGLRSKPFLPGACRKLFRRWICPLELLSNKRSGAHYKQSLSAKPAATAKSPAPLAYPRACGPWAGPAGQIQSRFSYRVIGCWRQMESSADFPADWIGSADCSLAKDCRLVDAVKPPRFSANAACALPSAWRSHRRNRSPPSWDTTRPSHTCQSAGL